MEFIRDIERQVRRLVLRLLREGAPYEQIERAVTKLLAPLGLTDSNPLAEQFIQQAQHLHEWIATRTLSGADRGLVSNVLVNSGNQFATVGGRVNKKLLAAVSDGLTKGKSERDIDNAVRRVMSGATHQLRTVVQTGLAGFDRIATVRDATENAIRLFRLEGPSPQRAWCMANYLRVYSRQQIEAMNNGQGLSVLIYCGGYNCKHFWAPVTSAELIEQWYTQYGIAA